jgi:DNA (cytosine-5)-methyltransferase 1
MRILDLFCGAGGASVGYSYGGARVVGVDINPQPHYPLTFKFYQADALSVLRGEHKDINPSEFDLIHASPPCQRYSKMTKRWAIEDSHPDLIGEVRRLILNLGMPYVIENVPGAPLVRPVRVCGSMFDLRIEGTDWQLRRHRMFETNFYVPQLKCMHRGRAVGVYGNSGGSSKRDGIKFPNTDGWREAMDINWMTGKELSEAIPPIYTEFILQWYPFFREG